MSHPFYWSEPRIAALREAAASWMGTPFHANARLKGVGVDCVNLGAAIYIESGLVPEMSFPHYTIGGARNADGSMVTEYLDGHPSFAKLGLTHVEPGKKPGCKSCGKPYSIPPQQGFKPGDLICLRVAKVPYHVGVVLDGAFFVQCYCGNKVRTYGLSDPTWGRRLVAAYRPIEP